MASRSEFPRTSRFRSRIPRPRPAPSPDPLNLPAPSRDSSVVSDQISQASAVRASVTSRLPRQTPRKPSSQPKLAAFKTVLRGLKTSLNALPPIQSAIGGLEECVAQLQIKEENSQAYEEIVSNLTNLSNLLQRHTIGLSPRSVPYSIANISQAIEEQTRFIQERQSQARVNQLAMAMEEEETVMKCYQKIGVLFMKLQADISLSIWDEIQEQKMNACLKELLPVYEAYYNTALPITVSKRVACTENTRVELLDTIQAWVRSENGAKIFWLNGMAGTGKTTIAYTICKQLQATRRLGGSFFCSRNSPDCRDVRRVLPTIAYHLGRYSNPYRQKLCSALDEDPDVARRDFSTQFRCLISQPLVAIGKAMPDNVVIVIDALDECADASGTKDVLETLMKHTASLPIKFLIASRPEPSISNSMEARGNTLPSILRLHDIEESLVQADIRTYLEEALSSAQVSAQDIDALANKAKSLFIFAATAVRYIIPDDDVVDVQERLMVILDSSSPDSNKPYQDLDNLYKLILLKTLCGQILEKERQRRCRTLWTIVCAREPMTPATLSELLEVGTEKQIWLALQPFRSVLHVSASTGLVSTLHASFPDFLLSADRAEKFYCNPHEHNLYLAYRCFSRMDQQLRFNICNLETSYQLDREIPDLGKRVNAVISSELFYACRYWSDHLSNAKLSSALVSPLGRFLKRQFLFWMEVLSLKGKSNHAEVILNKMMDWLPSSNEYNELRYLAHDARNFATSFAANLCSLSTPHIYISALPFTPRHSQIWRIYWPGMQGLIRVVGAAVEARQKSALATWAVGKCVFSLAQSSDGRRIACGLAEFTSCFDRGEVSTWDASSGVCLVGPLKVPKGPVLTVAFSPDDSRIASGSTNSTIHIWDASTGNSITGPLRDHSDIVRSLAFSPDGTHLASGSGDHTIRTWNAFSGACVAEPLEGHKDGVTTVSFSPDGVHLASGSEDRTIRVWDWRMRTTVQGPIKGHLRSVYSIAYSHDGSRLVSGSKDSTIRIWDMSNCTLLAGPFKGHAGAVSSVAFSPDGTQVVSSSYDCTIRVWDSANGALLAGPFVVHDQYIYSVIFDIDGRRIISGSSDCTVRIWDARAGATDSFDYAGAVYSVGISPDGTRAASGSKNHTIFIWDVNSGEPVAGPLKGHTSIVSSVAFSPDGRRLVSGSDDYTLRLWDASTGAPLAEPLKGHTDYITPVTFSPDGSQVASGSYDKTIRIWSSRTGTPVGRPFEGHAEWITSVAFSPNGDRIVSGSDDNTVACGSFGVIVILDTRDGGVLHGPYTGHTDYVLSLAFSLDGSRIVSGSFDHTVRVWDVKTAAMIAGPLKGHTQDVRSVAFTPDNARIISGSRDGTIRVWDLEAIARGSNRPSDDWSIDEIGWLVDSDLHRLFWVPSDLRERFGFLTPFNTTVVNASCTTCIDASTLLGDRWHECFDSSSWLSSS